MKFQLTQEDIDTTENFFHPDDCVFHKAISRAFPGRKVQVLDQQVLVHQDNGAREVWQLDKYTKQMLYKVTKYQIGEQKIVKNKLTEIRSHLTPGEYEMTYEFTITGQQYKDNFKIWVKNGCIITKPE